MIKMYNCKRFSIIKTSILFILILLILLGCKDPANGYKANDHSSNKKGGSSISFSAEYVRDNGPFVCENEKQVYLIDTYDDYLKLIPGFENIDSRLFEGSTISSDILKTRYTKEWFSGNQLLYFGLLESSGSNRISVAAVQLDYKTVTIEVDHIIPEVFTDDVAGWQVLIEIERCLPEDAEFILRINN